MSPNNEQNETKEEEEEQKIIKQFVCGLLILIEAIE